MLINLVEFKVDTSSIKQKLDLFVSLLGLCLLSDGVVSMEIEDLESC